MKFRSALFYSRHSPPFRVHTRLHFALSARSIRQSAGPSLKSAFSHTWTKDTRDDRVQGSSGFYSKVSTEIAGLSELLGGSVATSSSGVAGEGKQKPQDAGLRSASHVKVEGEGSVGRSLRWLGWDGVVSPSSFVCGFVRRSSCLRCDTTRCYLCLLSLLLPSSILRDASLRCFAVLTLSRGPYKINH